jgi:hypothetical protein
MSHNIITSSNLLIYFFTGGNGGTPKEIKRSAG